MKTCYACKVSKPLDAFSRDRQRPDGINPECRECSAKRTKEWRSDPLNRAKGLATSAAWARTEKGRVSGKDKRYKNLYGISHAQFLEMVKMAGGICQICERVLVLGEKTSATAVLDHCHDTKRVRGVLCHSCNAGIGQLGDSPARLRKAIVYLES